MNAPAGPVAAETRRPPAVVLVSGGLDSATCLAIARAEGFACHALSFAYGQRHEAELAAARRVATALGAVQHRVMTIDLAAFGGSALTDPSIAVPETPSGGIPVTYVPARNTIFLSMALAWSEVLGAHDIFIGVNAVDYSGYPDCRPEFIESFERMANLATRAGVEDVDAAAHPCAADLDEQGRDHPAWRFAGCGLRPDGVLLPGRRAGPGLRRVRFVPIAARGVRRGRRAGSDLVPVIGRARSGIIRALPGGR